MAIHRLLKEAVFDQEDIDCMTAAYEGALRALQPSDRTDPFTEIVANSILTHFRQGVREADQLIRLAISDLAKPVAE